MSQHRPVQTIGKTQRARPLATRRLPRRERGAFAIMTGAIILVIFGFFALAIDLGRVYNRKVELQSVADTIALAAAAQLDGTDAGVARALLAASDAARDMSYSYNKAFVEWTDAAISFASSPNAAQWIESTSTAGRSATLFFVRVDTGLLDRRHGSVATMMMRVLDPQKGTAQVGSRAVAGRSTVNIAPLAICAMSPTAAAARGTELVEYGFRRGIDYDLMQLNPNSTTQPEHFLLNPIAPPGTTGAAVSQRLDLVKPFVCTGTLGIAHVSGQITVERNFPLGSLFTQLNSRFGTYASPCTSTTAPPDINVKPYTYSSALTWMQNVPARQSAVARTSGSALMTLPDLPAAEIPANTTADLYGPLWLYAKPAKYASYVPGTPEPAGGYATFGTGDLATLYPIGSPRIKSGSSYPSPTPYASAGQSQSPPNGLRGVANRRVLHVPLLRCPVPTGSPALANVLAVGKFFMTVPATSSELYAEFAGLAQPSSLFGQVELYP